MMKIYKAGDFLVFYKQVLYLLVMLIFSTNGHALNIQHVSHLPIKPSYKSGEIISVQFLLDEAAGVSLNIYDDREYLVRTVKSSTVLKQGDHIIKWDGKDEKGKLVPHEAYHYTLEANNGADKITHDVTDLTGNEKGVIRGLKWDKEKHTISYTLINAARINFRAGIKDGGPLLKTVINWLPRSRGKHVEMWDDNDEEINISNISGVELFSDAYSLSKNTIIIGNKISSLQYVDIANPVERKRTQAVAFRDYKSMVAQDRSDYMVDIELSVNNNHKNNTPIYTGKISVKINVPPTDLERLNRDRFESILFVDGEYVSELETAFFPISWMLDTGELDDGEHYVTINIRGYNGQYGSSTKMIYVGEKL